MHDKARPMTGDDDMPIENTAERDNLLHLAGVMSEGQNDYITGMEAAGQRQLVASTLLPTDAQGDFEALGFTFGDVVDGDDLFREATLPDGWSKQGSDHAMWSHIVDERGIRRVSIFYKAAFYDRRAFMRIDNVGRTLAYDFIYAEGPVDQPLDLLTDEERAEYRGGLRSYLDDADQHPDIYGERVPKVQERLALLDG